jgi:hypothetical protein
MRSPNPRPPVSGPAGTRQMQGDLTEPARQEQPPPARYRKPRPNRPPAQPRRAKRTRAPRSPGNASPPQARTGETTRTSRPPPLARGDPRHRARCPRRKTGAAGTTRTPGKGNPKSRPARRNPRPRQTTPARQSAQSQQPPPIQPDTNTYTGTKHAPYSKQHGIRIILMTCLYSRSQGIVRALPGLLTYCAIDTLAHLVRRRGKEGAGRGPNDSRSAPSAGVSGQ